MNKLLLRATTWINLTNNAGQNKPCTKEYQLYDSFNIRLRNRCNSFNVLEVMLLGHVIMRKVQHERPEVLMMFSFFDLGASDKGVLTL